MICVSFYYRCFSLNYTGNYSGSWRATTPWRGQSGRTKITRLRHLEQCRRWRICGTLRLPNFCKASSEDRRAWCEQSSHHTHRSILLAINQSSATGSCCSTGLSDDKLRSLLLALEGRLHINRNISWTYGLPAIKIRRQSRFDDYPRKSAASSSR